MRFEGKVLLVTGGASGLGAAVGRRFAAEGGRVAVADRDDDRAGAVAGELDGAIALSVDVADEDSVGRCVDTVAQHLGSVDCLFNAAKGAIAAFSRQLARDVAPEIRVNTVAPGRTRTGMTEPLMIARAGSVEQGSIAFGQGNLQKRVAEPEEIAAPVCFLLSGEASFITGALLAVDGGETA